MEGLEPQVYFVSSALLLPQCCFYSTTSERGLLKMKGRGLRCVNTRVDPNVHSHLWRHSGLFFCFSWVFYFCKAGFCCLTVFWRWEKYILLPQILSFCLIFHLKRKVVATLKAYGLTFLHVFMYLAVGKLVFLLPQGSFLCIWKKYKAEVKDTSGFQTCRLHFTSPATLLLQTALQFFLCLHSSTNSVKSYSPS